LRLEPSPVFIRQAHDNLSIRDQTFFSRQRRWSKADYRYSVKTDGERWRFSKTERVLGNG
jgi:hypothetical protein